MSEALEYLLKARPEAMQAYFSFLKEAGRHLDPKTRAIISVITKVAAQTDAGFRQYLSRALKAGVTPNEILDALLLAFPALGLTKVAWAVDILLEMDIPEFRLEALGGESRWHDVGAVDSIAVGETVRVACDGRELFVRRAGEQFQVFDSHCPHQKTNIPASAIGGERLTCPRHGWVFDLASGECVERGDRPLQHFASRTENGRLLAYW